MTRLTTLVAFGITTTGKSILVSFLGLIYNGDLILWTVNFAHMSILLSSHHS